MLRWEHRRTRPRQSHITTNMHAHPLPEIHKGTHVATQNLDTKQGDIYGVVVDIGPHCRYNVKSAGGRVLTRNHCFLCLCKPTFTPSCVMVPLVPPWHLLELIQGPRDLVKKSPSSDTCPTALEGLEGEVWGTDLGHSPTSGLRTLNSFSFLFGLCTLIYCIILLYHWIGQLICAEFRVRKLSSWGVPLYSILVISMEQSKTYGLQ